jgi:hypothetical protein
MNPTNKEIIIQALKILAKVAFTGLAYGLIARVWRW